MSTEQTKQTRPTQSAESTPSAKKSIIFGVGVVVLTMVLLALSGFIFFGEKEDIITGQVEVDEIRIAGKVPGRITEFLVEEGQQVHAGDTLVRIYSPEVLAKLEQAEEKEGAYELWQKAKAGLEVAEKTFARAETLYKEGVLPAQKFDEATAQLNAMRDTERAARSQYDMALNGAQREDKWAAQALVDRASGAVSEVGAYLKEAALVAPIDGLVAEIYPHRGELVGTGAPIMSIADYSAVRVLFAVREDKLAGLRQGSTLRGTIPALGNKPIELKVTKMKDMGSYATWKATTPRDQHDLRTFEITTHPAKPVEGLLAGMTIILDKGQL